MKILQLFHVFPHEYQPQNIRVLNLLTKAGVDIIAVSFIQGNHPRAIAKPEFPIIQLSNNLPWASRRLIQIIRIVKGLFFHHQAFALFERKKNKLPLKDLVSISSILDLRPDVVHIQHINAVNNNLISALQKKNIPWVISFRGSDLLVRPLNESEWYSKLNMIFSHSSGIHVISNALKQKAIELGAPTEKIHVIYRSSESNTNDVFHKNSFPPHIITSVGRLDWEKGHLYALDAIAILHNKGISIEYYIIGSGSLELGLRFRAKQLGITDQVKFVGYASQTDIDAILAKTYLFLFPSLSEALGNSLIHAQSLGIPVVGSNVGGIPEVVIHEKTGLLVPPGEPHSIAKAIEILISDPGMWLSFSNAAKERIKNVFLESKEIDLLIQLYKSFL